MTNASSKIHPRMVINDIVRTTRLCIIAMVASCLLNLTVTIACSDSLSDDPDVDDKKECLELSSDCGGAKKCCTESDDEKTPEHDLLKLIMYGDVPPELRRGSKACTEPSGMLTTAFSKLHEDLTEQHCNRQRRSGSCPAKWDPSKCCAWRSFTDKDFEGKLPQERAEILKHRAILLESNGNENYVLCPTPKINHYYKIGDQLGQPGTFGTAFEATRIDTMSSTDTDNEFAVKRITKKKFRRTSHTMEFFRDLRKEILIMSKCKGLKNIIQMEEVFEDEEYLYIVMEKCTGGELFDRVNDKLTEDIAKKVLYDMCSALKQLHDMNIGHFDLKPENFLLKSNNEDDKENYWKIKMIDFGMSDYVPKGHALKGCKGTLEYFSPEMTYKTYNLATDMWSLGVIAFIMVIHSPPFYAGRSNHQEKIFKVIRNGFHARIEYGHGPYFPRSLRHKYSDLFIDFVEICLRFSKRNYQITRDPILSCAQRATIDEAMHHPWFHPNSDEHHDEIISGLEKYFEGPPLQRCVLMFWRDKVLLEEYETKRLTTFLTAHKAGSSAGSDTDGSDIEELGGAEFQFYHMDETSDCYELELLKKTGFMDSGLASVHELALSECNRKLLAKESRLKMVFYILDRHHRGYVSKSDLIAFYQQFEDNRVVIKKKVKRDMEQVDKDGNKEITYEEFRAIWHKSDKPHNVDAL